jgi:hypothetical protein
MDYFTAAVCILIAIFAEDVLAYFRPRVPCSAKCGERKDDNPRPTRYFLE